jgi:hypothetical protein
VLCAFTRAFWPSCASRMLRGCREFSSSTHSDREDLAARFNFQEPAVSYFDTKAFSGLARLFLRCASDSAFSGQVEKLNGIDGNIHYRHPIIRCLVLLLSQPRGQRVPTVFGSSNKKVVHFQTTDFAVTDLAAWSPPEFQPCCFSSTPTRRLCLADL